MNVVLAATVVAIVSIIGIVAVCFARAPLRDDLPEYLDDHPSPPVDVTTAPVRRGES
jgi:hypothetical protein